MQFIDEATIRVRRQGWKWLSEFSAREIHRAGWAGRWQRRRWRRFLVADEALNTLMFRYQPSYQARNGHGEGSRNKTDAAGEASI